MMCKHKKEFCRKCQGSEKYNTDAGENYMDLVDEIHMRDGYRLVKGFNLLCEDSESW